MRSKNRLYFLYVVFVVVIAAVALMLVTGWRPDLAREASNSTPPTRPVDTSVTPTSVTSETLANEEELSSNVDGFLMAYYQRLPGDTAEAYVERLVPFASPEFLSQLDLTQFERDPFLSMSERAASIEVRFDEGDVSITFDTESPNLAWVVVQMDQYELSAGGEEELQRQDMESSTEWRLVDGQWLVYPSLPR